jgi:hypothetical protein
MSTIDSDGPRYEPPALQVLGSLAELTLAPCKPTPGSHVPDHVYSYFCDDGSVIVVGSA